MVMTIAVFLILFGVIGIGYSIVRWSNNRRGL